MKEQHSELVVTAEEEEKQAAAIAKAEKEYGFVVVSSGEGLANVFYDLGVDSIVQGGQTMNPSTEDILRAVNQTPASTVFVFPNNKNIIMAAEQAVPISKEKRIMVIPTKTIAQGVTALLNFDESASPEENQTNMEKAAHHVRTGQVTFAARDSRFDGRDIKEGQMLGMAEGELKVVGENLLSAVMELIELMKSDQSEILTLYYGADVTKEQAQEILSQVEEAYKDQFEITLIDGGQPVYYMIIAVE
jgi:dihydroxyacetone kinase-like predicted kinase